MNMTRLSGFCKMKAWPSSWMRGTTMWLPFTRRTAAGSLILSASSRICLTQGPAAFTLALRRHEAGVGQDGRAVRRRGARVEHHQARVVDPAVVVDEAALEFGLQARPVAVGCEPHALRSRQRAPGPEAEHAVTEMIVEEKARADHPCGPQVRFVRQHEFHRPDDVRGDPEQRFALGERLGDETEFEVLQVAKPAVDELGRGRRGRRGEIVLLDQQHLQAAPGGIARDTRAVDAAAYDQEIVTLGVHAGGFYAS